MILPPSERGLGNGIFNSGAAVGAVVTPLVVTLMTAHFGWRTTFAVIGALGFVWVAVWMTVVGRSQLAAPVTDKKPSLEPIEELAAPSARLSTAARRTFGAVVGSAVVIGLSSFRFGAPALWWGIAWLMFGFLFAARALPMAALQGIDWAEGLGTVVRFRRFWVLAVVSISINVCWHFLVSWLPSYLKDDRGMSFVSGGLLSSVPFLAADVGNLGGGYLAPRSPPWE